MKTSASFFFIHQHKNEIFRVFFFLKELTSHGSRVPEYQSPDVQCIVICMYVFN